VPTALIVDDAADLRALLRHLLGRAGFDVLEAASGPEALAQLSLGDVPDVAIIDVQMPGMDGWETLAQLRRDRLTSELPVLLCTVKSGPADLLRAWELGCDGYLEKPFDIAELVTEVEAVQARTADQRVAFREQRRLAAMADALPPH
jgi:CheY-like chemotaxis protein